MARTRSARPGIWASTRRAAAASQKANGWCRAEATPWRTRSKSHRSNSSIPADIVSIRCASRFACASGSGGAASFAAPADPGALAASRCTHSAAKSAGRASSATDPSPCAHSSSRASPCLQGCFRLGQVHRNDGSVRSTVTWYGSRALPWHFPHSNDPLDPACDHTADSDNRRAAPAELPSGASSSTSSTVHRFPPMTRSW